MENGMAVYRILREKTRNWWYHKKLREDGQASKAWRHEKRSIRESLERLKNAKEIEYYRWSGSFLMPHIDPATGYRGTLSGYNGYYLVRCCLLMGIPVREL